MSGALGYNERSWAIDLISAINDYTKTKKLSIRRAGGEKTLKGKRSLFPDVLLYGDSSAGRVRQGWELKFPDTSISDPELLENAQAKAERLGLNSFLVWNVDEAALYVRADETGSFDHHHAWPSLGIKKRADVEGREAEWISLLHTILNDLNAFLDDGTIRSATPSEILDDAFIADFLTEYAGVASDSIKSRTKKLTSKDALISTWWSLNAPELGKKPTDPIDYNRVAQIAVLNWVNRFVFCHYLKTFNSDANAVDGIVVGTSIEDAQTIFEKITSSCDFLQVFTNEVAASDVGEEAWEGLCQLNGLLVAFRLEEVPQEALHKVVERVLQSARRKVAGQFTTPNALADLLVAMTIEDREAPLLDPCCGTGTIARAAYDYRRRVGQSPDEALSTLWASDKFQFPLQLCTLALADPEAMGEVVQVAKRDVFDVTLGEETTFVDPLTGNSVTRETPAFGTVVSNLPFVRAEQFAKANDKAVLSDKLPNRSDLYGHIILKLAPLVIEHGRVGLIVSNSWLGTDFGSDLREAIKDNFRIRTIVTSASGRWFANAEVVTNILVLEQGATNEKDTVAFVSTGKPIEAWTIDYIDSLAADVIAGGTVSKEDRSVTTLTTKDISLVEKHTGAWSGLFADMSWLSELAPMLVPVTDHLDVARGKRRGWNPMFYPAEGHEIEPAYIVPALKNLRNTKGYNASPAVDAFCCSKSIAELKALGDTGALAWIGRFENEKNGTGVPLTTSLKEAGSHWYEMKPTEVADFVMGMAPEDRISVARMNPRGFVDQRLMRLTTIEANADLDLLHALLNCSLSLLMIEASGFGRGLGALDLTPTKIAKHFPILDPSRLDNSQVSSIKKAFASVAGRDVLKLSEELGAADRAALDEAILAAYGLGDLADRIRESHRTLYRIRKSVKDDA